MVYKKKGIPEENSVVLCTVKNILPNAIFCELDEYENQEGMIYISEVAPGRIRNIRDYVKEGKKLVCLVLRVDPVKKHVDLSLRRVPLSLRNKKNEEYKQEQKSEKLLGLVAKELGISVKEVYEKIGVKLIDHFGLLGHAFSAIAATGADEIKELKLPPREAEVLVRVVQEKIKPVEVNIPITIVLQSTAEHGVNDIKEILRSGADVAKKQNVKMTILYISAPRYRLEVFANDYKTAEEGITQITEVVLNEAKKRKASCEVVREKK